MTKPYLYEAVQGFLGPIMAEYALLIEDGDPLWTVTVQVGSHPVEMKLGAIQALNRAHAAEFDRRQARAERKANQDDLINRLKSGKAMR
jgi:hypothetical protein